MSISYEYIGTH